VAMLSDAATSAKPTKYTQNILRSIALMVTGSLVLCCSTDAKEEIAVRPALTGPLAAC